jgi:hypothetical protein
MTTSARDDGQGEAQPEPNEDILGEKTFGDEKAENSGDPKIVDYPENSEDISEDISDAEQSAGSQS